MADLTIANKLAAQLLELCHSVVDATNIDNDTEIEVWAELSRQLQEPRGESDGCPFCPQPISDHKVFGVCEFTGEGSSLRYEPMSLSLGSEGTAWTVKDNETNRWLVTIGYEHFADVAGLTTILNSGAKPTFVDVDNPKNWLPCERQR